MNSTIPPKINIQTNYGPCSFRYNISTPSNVNAECIEDPKSIPTLLFIHPEYVASEAWQNQWHSSLRRFNLVSFDLRSHGDTYEDVPEGYSRVEAAQETGMIMDALNLPACHLIGGSMGADIALQMAIDSPERVLSLTLIAPLADEEHENVQSARQEIFEAWSQGDEENSLHALSGALQLLNDMDNPLIQSFIALQYPRSKRNWASSPQAIETFSNITIKYFMLNRERQQSKKDNITSSSDSDSVTPPLNILILDCTEDVAAPDAPILARTLQSARTSPLRLQRDNAVSVTLVEVQGAPHLGHMTHSKFINEQIERFIAPLCPGGMLPPVPEVIVTPWDTPLRALGWIPLEDEEEEEDDDDGFI